MNSKCPYGHGASNGILSCAICNVPCRFNKSPRYTAEFYADSYFAHHPEIKADKTVQYGKDKCPVFSGQKARCLGCGATAHCPYRDPSLPRTLPNLREIKLNDRHDAMKNPCECFTFDVDFLVRHVDERTRKAHKELLARLKNYEPSMEKAGSVFETLWQDVVDYVKSDEFFARLNYICRLRTAMNLSNIQIESDTMKEEQVVHVCLGDDRHHYFGSVAAIFDKFTPEELGVSLTTLWNYGLSPDHPYINNKCRIYRGTIDRKKQTK